MKTNSSVFSVLILFLLLFSTCSSDAQTGKKSTASKVTSKIEVIQFHSEHRCVTCNKIETLTKATLKQLPGVPFYLVNVDAKENEAKAQQFEATGTALFLFDPASGKKQYLTDFAFMNANNENKFIEGLKKAIDLFKKQ
jgi:hypothetical protein